MFHSKSRGVSESQLTWVTPFSFDLDQPYLTRDLPPVGNAKAIVENWFETQRSQLHEEFLMRAAPVSTLPCKALLQHGRYVQAVKACRDRTLAIFVRLTNAFYYVAFELFCHQKLLQVGWCSVSISNLHAVLGIFTQQR